MYETARQATLLRSISAIISHVLNEKQRLTIQSYNYAIHRVFYLRMKLRCRCAPPCVRAKRCKDELTAHVLAAVTLSALSLTYRVWFSKGKKDVASAAQQVFSELAKAICGE